MSSSHTQFTLAQSQITIPRDSNGNGSSVLAKVDNTKLSTGNDGKLYKLLNVSDQAKFHLEKQTYVIESKNTNNKPRSSSSSSSSLSSTTILRRKLPLSNTRPNKTILDLSKVSNANSNPPPSSYRPYKGQEDVIINDNNNKELHLPNLSNSIEFHNNTSLIDETNVLDIALNMKEKYELNLQVINKLFNDKKKMEKRMKMLENKVRRSQAGLSLSPNSKKTKSKDDMEDVKENDDNNITYNNTRNRSKSAPPSKLKISDKLLISQIQYIEKRRLLEVQEKQKQEEEEKLLNEQKERFARASIHGKAFTEMLARTERAKSLSHEKMMKAKLEEEKKLKKAIEDKRRNRIEKEEKLKTAALTEKTWEVIVKEEEQKRSERIQKRKAELQLLSNAPACASIKTEKLSIPKSSGQAELSQMFIAEDPSKVTARLARQKQAWDRKLLEEQEKSRRLDEQRALKQRNIPVSTAVLSMQAREQMAASKQKERELIKKKKLEDEEKNKQKAEKRKMEKILKENIPDSARRLTKSAENRARIVREQKEKEEKEAKEAEIARKKKEKLDREIAAVVAAEVREKEYQRKLELHKKSGSSKPFELIDVEKAAEIKKLEAKKEFLTKLSENKKKIQDAMQSRPSLIERHEKQMVARARGTKALIQVANVLNENKNDDKYDDFLDLKEKIIYKNSKTMI